MESIKGTTIMVPVYESDGETVIGEFQAGGGGAGGSPPSK